MLAKERKGEPSFCPIHHVLRKLSPCSTAWAHQRLIWTPRSPVKATHSKWNFSDLYYSSPSGLLIHFRIWFRFAINFAIRISLRKHCHIRKLFNMSFRRPDGEIKISWQCLFKLIVFLSGQEVNEVSKWEGMGLYFTAQFISPHFLISPRYKKELNIQNVHTSKIARGLK